MNGEIDLFSQVIRLPFRLLEDHQKYFRRDLSFSIVHGDLPDLQKRASFFLHPEEWQLFQSYAHVRRQHSFLLGRYAGKMALTHFLNNGCDPDPTAFSIRQGLLGEPLLHPAGSLITISHSGLFGTAIVSDHYAFYGIDLELTAHFQEGRMSFLREQDTLYLQHVTKWDLITCRGALWTAHESLSKYFKTGLLLPSELFTFSDIFFDNSVLMILFKNFPFLKTYIFSSQIVILAITCSKRIILDCKDITYTLENLEKVF